MSIEQDADMKPPYLGPHEGREFDLMRSGEKHLAMFTIEDGYASESYPDPRFEAAVQNGEIIKGSYFCDMVSADGTTMSLTMSLKTIMYASPTEEWRMRAMELVQEVYCRRPGWKLDLERMIGALLGYSDEDVEAFIERLIRLESNIADNR